MRRMQFDELVLLSQPERAARRVKFDPRSTVLKGSNDTGKSSILKALYWTLGAEPAVQSEKWSDTNAISSLKFSIDASSYRMVRAGTRFALFDGSDNLIRSYVSVTTELGPAIAELFSFRLRLRTTSKQTEIQATPAFLFLPFYIDQDLGWTDTLNSFAHLKQFKSPKADVYAFHFGVRPSEFYSAKSRASQAEASAAPLRVERGSLHGVLAKLDQTLRTADFNTNLDAFRDEVDALIARCSSLKEEEERLRLRMADKYAALAAVADQIEITEGARAELRADRESAATIPNNHVRCPTCHAEYDNGFAERFSIAVDEDRCITLLGQLDEEHRLAQAEYDKSREETERARTLVAEVQVLLSAKHGELVLNDILRSEGRMEVRRIIDGQADDYSDRITGFEKEARAARVLMRKYTNTKRAKETRDAFRGDFGRLLQRLGVISLSTSSLERPESKLHGTGSDLPRAVLAHFFASVRTIARSSTCAFCPLVIDSPRQQDQDPESWERIRTVINEERPDNSQLILALGDDGSTDFGGQVLEFTEKYALLQKSAYAAARDEIMPLVERSLRPT